MKNLEQMLQESELRYKLLFEKTPNAILLLAGDTVVDCNPAALKMFKRTREELIGCKPHDLSPKFQMDGSDSLEKEKEILSKVEVDTSLQYCWTCIDTEGNLIETEIYLTHVEIQGNEFLLGIIHDITASKKLERELRAAKKFTESLIDNANTMIMMLDKDQKAKIFNKAAQEITGYSFDDVKDQNLIELLVPRERYPEIWASVLSFLNGKCDLEKIPYEFESPITTKYDEEKWILWRNTLIKVVEQIVGTLSFGIDITDKRTAEQEYQQLFKTSPIAIFIAQGNNFKLGNPAVEQILGYELDDLIKNRTITELIYKDDLDMVMGRYKRRLQGEEVETNYSFRVYAGDGTIKWVEITSALVEWDGRPATLNFAINVTQRKQAQQQYKDMYEKQQRTFQGIVKALRLVVDTRDSYTANHQARVAQLSMAIAKEYGLSDDDIHCVEIAANIHDIGKLGVPSELLSKPSELSSAEFELIKTHTTDGYDILKTIDFQWPIAEIVYQHHEKWDGSGYPRGLKEDKILIEAQIISIADIIEAISSHRPYRPALGIDVALQELIDGKGTKFNPELVDICVKLFREKGFKFAEIKY